MNGTAVGFTAGKPLIDDYNGNKTCSNQNLARLQIHAGSTYKRSQRLAKSKNYDTQDSHVVPHRGTN